MTRELRFWKYHGTGNDFLLFYAAEGDLSVEEVANICDRHTGVGADGIIRVVPGGQAVEGFAGAESADVVMDYRNADGSNAEMCGNGIRCLAAFAHDRGLTSKSDLVVATRDGTKHLHVDGEGDERSISVEMGPARFERMHVPMHGPAWETFVDQGLGDDEDWTGTAVSMGNPHLVVFVEDPAAARVDALGPRLEHHELFPERTNVEFVLQSEPGDIFPARVWERGVGETMACGTGACAIIAAANATGRGGASGTVRFPGGDLRVELAESGVTLTGPAVEVFEGSLRL